VSTASLLTFLDAPVVVGDPDGRTAYVNPAFAARFGVAGEDATGQPLSALFEGGVREAVLRAVVECCEQGRSVRFRVRHGGVGYAAVASPITAESARVGVVILLAESSAVEERLLGLQREISEPVGELRRVLDELLDQTGGRRDERYRTLLEDGNRALARVQKWCDELAALAAGQPATAAGSDASFDVVRLLQEVTARVRTEFATRGAELEVLAPSRLPRVRGDGTRVERALVRLLRDRLSEAGESPTITLAARPVGRGEARSIVISVSDNPAARGAPAAVAQPIPSGVLEIVQALGGEIRTSADPLLGRTTAIRLDVMPD
jgi:nitrogen-specific signal transduction histidine kinase